MELGKVWVDSVIVGTRHRALDETKVDALAESMKAIGLQQPISVYSVDEYDVQLIAGLHRLEAAKRLGWEQVDASFVKLSPARREMWEIAENLFRVDLTKEQRDDHIRRYAELIEQAEAEDAAIVPQNAAVIDKPKRSRGQPKGTAQKIADQTGLSKDTVQRALNKTTKTAADYEAEKAREEAARINREQDAAIKVQASEEFAEWILARSDLHEIPAVISWLEVVKPSDVAAALRRAAA